MCLTTSVGRGRGKRRRCRPAGWGELGQSRPNAVNSYVLRGGAAGAERLGLLGRVMGPTTEALQLRAGLAPGMRCLDAGCGAGMVALALARRVGPGGQVVGVDVDEAALDLARRQAHEQNLPVVFRAESVFDLAE